MGYDVDASLESAAEAHYRAGEFGPALGLYSRLYEGGWRTPALCLNMANLCVRSGDRNRAASLLRECLDLGGVDPETDRKIEGNIRFLEGS